MKTNRFGKNISVVSITLMVLLSPVIIVNADIDSNTLQNQDSKQYQSNIEPNKYAVIIVGSYGTKLPGQNISQIEENRTKYYQWYLTDVQLMYDVLKDKYGYDDDHICVLITKIKEYDFPEEFDESIIDFPSNKATMRNIFRSFKRGNKNELDENDNLFVVFINHGLDGRYFLKKWFKIPNKNGVDAHNTFFALEPRFNFIFKNVLKYDFFYYRLFFSNSAMWDYQFAQYVKGIKAKMVFALQPCFSGGFINDLSGKNRIICTAAMENELADCWIGPFRRALNDEVNADYNKDGDVSIVEAYRYAAEYVEIHGELGSQHPLIDDNGDGIGHHHNETGYDPDTPEMDGYLAAHTFL